jgi:Sulfotransferase domain
MKTVYLHLGMPKTGTTFLQTRYFPHLEGVSYQNKEIVELLNRVIYSNPVMLDLNSIRHEADGLLNRVNKDRLLISQERLFGDMLRNYQDNVYLTGCLKVIFPRAKLIIVVRRQDDLVESIYKQSLQSYCYQKLNSFLNYRHKTFADALDQHGLPNIDVKQINLYSYVRNYVQHFGKDNVTVLPYELLRRDQSAFLNRLAAAINVAPFQPAVHHEENRSYSWLSCRIALGLNRFVRVEGDGSRVLQFIPNKPLSRLLRKEPAEGGLDKILRAINRRLTLRHVLQNGVDRVVYVRRNLISQKKRERIMEFHRESNARLDREFNLDLKLYGYYSEALLTR